MTQHCARLLGVAHRLTLDGKPAEQFIIVAR